MKGTLIFSWNFSHRFWIWKPGKGGVFMAFGPFAFYWLAYDSDEMATALRMKLPGDEK